MKNTKNVIGPWKIQVPELVMKLGLVYDSYKAPHRLKLWKEAEAKARDQLLAYGLANMFHEEQQVSVDGKLTYEFRYYTPPTNRVRLSPGDDVVILDTPQKCREFLKNVRMGPKGEPIGFLQQADGKRVSIDEASDWQVEQVAIQISEALNKASAH